MDFDFLNFQIDELNGNIQSYRSTISEKDTKLRELEAKLENVSADQREQELFKQIADYKEKNNVSEINFFVFSFKFQFPKRLNNFEIDPTLFFCSSIRFL